MSTKQGLAPIFIGIIVAVIILAAAGVYLWKSTRPAVVPAAPTAGWKTYTNKQSVYTFNLKIPINWFVEESTATDDSVKNTIKNCEKDYAYEVGSFRFKSYDYPEDFLSMGWMPEDAPNGAILDIGVVCSLGSLNNYKNSGNQGVDSLSLLVRDGLQEDKENYQQSLLNLHSIYHEGLEYRFMPIIYTKNGTTESEKEKLKTEFLPILNQMLSTFKFIK
jgi:hypothetical protein